MLPSYNSYYIPNFNSIKVQLKLGVRLKSTVCKPDFNSIKVQLKQGAAVEVLSGPKFQFHKGTIKTGFRHII